MNIKIWMHELSDLLRVLLGSPRNQVEFLVLLGVAVFVLFIAMYIAGRATRIPNLGLIRRGLSSLIGIPVIMCAWIAMQTYLLPHFEIDWVRYVVMVGVPLLAGVFVVIPVQMVIFRSAYVATMITFVSTLLLAALFVILTHAVLSAVSGGEKESLSIEKHRNDINKIIDQ